MGKQHTKCAECGVGYKLTKKQQKAILDSAHEMSVGLEDEIRAWFQDYLNDSDSNIEDEIYNTLTGRGDGGFDEDTPEQLKDQMIEEVIELLSNSINISWGFRKKN